MRKPWEDVDYDVADVRAIQALFAYADAAVRPPPPGSEPQLTHEEARRALHWIMNVCCMGTANGTKAALASGDHAGITGAFVDGRRAVGQEIAKLASLKPSIIEELARRARAEK
jgi:hypothetical protein